MAYEIEMLSVGDDLYSTLEAAAKSLNAVQSQFRFSSAANRTSGIGFKRSSYLTKELWDFLRAERTQSGGRRPFIIAFVNAPLASERLSNLFGSHEGADGLAIVTLHSHQQYVKETERFCAYYLVRYAMSFVNPHIKAHFEPERSACYFHMKMYKPEISESMNSGELCDACRTKLDTAEGGAPANRLSNEEREALTQMRKVVAGTFPRAVIMKGGGVKGLAFAGALVELERHFYFDRHVGTSAGAIAATLLAAGYRPIELVRTLSEKSFRAFLDAPFWSVPFNLLVRRGCYPGNHFQDWMAGLLHAKVQREGDVRMRDLTGALTYATQRVVGTIAFDSQGDRRDSIASFAARCSMSIPFFFMPQMVDGRRTYDGGMRHNFPLRKFLESNPNAPFVALYLRGTRKDGNGKSVLRDMFDIWLDGEEREEVDKHRRDIVVVDTNPVGTVDFNLSALEKEFLLKVGKAAALRFLFDRKIDSGPDAVAVENAHQEAEQLRKQVRAMRARRRAVRGLVVLVAVCAGLYFVRGLLPT